MGDFVIQLITNYGYFGMFLGMILEAIIIAIPSELILATGGILASKKIFTFWGAFLIGLLGSIFCAMIIYWMGYYGGKAFIKKYGKYFFMKEEDIEKSDTWFNKYGMLSALIGRNIPIVRTLISLPMGITRQPFLKFILYTTIGSIPWTFLFVYVGYILGENWIILNTYIHSFKKPIIGILLILIFYTIYKKMRQGKAIEKTRKIWYNKNQKGVDNI